MTDHPRIDAHQHYWDPIRADYGWLTADLPILFKPFQPADLAPSLHAARITGTVLVQAAPTVEETDYLLALARTTPSVKGVVGWIDFENPEHITHLKRWSTEPLLKGVRPMVQDIQDPDWLLKPEIDWAFEALKAFDLSFDALVLPIHLPRLLKRLQRHPTLRVCIDHAAKPSIRTRAFEPWASDLAQVARDSTAFCKVSGLITEATAEWTPHDLRPYLDHLLQIFGPDRLIFGSDWPVLLLNGDYPRWMDLLMDWTQSFSQTERCKFFGGNAVHFYKIDA